MAALADEGELRKWSFLALLVGGVLILVGGVVGVLMVGAWSMLGVWLGEDAVAPGWGAWATALGVWIGVVSFATGVLALVAANRVLRSRHVVGWGVVGIVAGAASLFAMGGYLVGAVAAIVGGVLALASAERSPSALRAAG